MRLIIIQGMVVEKLHNRRAGIEPLIGHLKQGWQMGRSRMKSDPTTLSAGYSSVLGFNLRQLKRYLTTEGILNLGDENIRDNKQIGDYSMGPRR